MTWSRIYSYNLFQPNEVASSQGICFTFTRRTVLTTICIKNKWVTINLVIPTKQFPNVYFEWDMLLNLKLFAFNLTLAKNIYQMSIKLEMCKKYWLNKLTKFYKRERLFEKFVLLEATRKKKTVCQWNRQCPITMRSFKAEAPLVSRSKKIQR